MEQRIKIRDIQDIKTQTAVKRLMDKGEEIDRWLVTKVTFEGQLDSEDIAQIHRLLKAGHKVDVEIYSPQLSMALEER